MTNLKYWLIRTGMIAFNNDRLWHLPNTDKFELGEKLRRTDGTIWVYLGKDYFMRDK